ncbi:MAG TPA: zinc-binding dehydrogenase [Acidimicrobiales bacterium]|nr:zinc-binding dehydrogenase [Acidimicrobiales bacterium]
MRAAVVHDKRLVVEDVPEPVPASGQILVETIACGICGSDLHALQHADTLISAAEATGSPFVFEPNGLVMGHEFSARVLELGPDAAGVVEPGDVIVSMPVVLTPGGFAAVGYSNQYPGGYAERMVLSSMLALRVPNGLDPRHAALTEPMAVGLHAVNKSGIKKGEAALVMGCGPVGLAVIAGLALAGIEPIVAADFSPMRRGLATTMGAHEVVDPRHEPAVEAWQRVDGRKPLVIFEAVGVPGMLDRAMRDAPRLSRILVVGVCMENDTVWPMMGINKELTIQFALGYDPGEFGQTLRSIAEGVIDVVPLITGEVGISGVPQSFADLADPEAHAKILVEPALD